MPTLLSIQVGPIAPLGPNGEPSAFVKMNVTGSVHADTLGLDGDSQADLDVHGGPDKAVYFYSAEQYPRWMADVPRHAALLVAGGFGENLTVAGLDEETVSIGDVYAIGSAQFQVTQPRQPCFKLGLRFQDNSLGRIMMKTGRTGWYVRVLVPGKLTAGEEVRLVRRPNPEWSIARFNRFVIHKSATPAELQELAAMEGLADQWRSAIAASLRA